MTGLPGSEVSPMATQFATAWEERLDFNRLRAYRLRRVDEVLAEVGLDGVIVFKHDNIRYLTGYRPLMWETGYITRNLAVYPRGGRPVVLTHAGGLAQAKLSMPWMKEGELIGLGSMEDPGIARTVVQTTIAEILGELGLERGQIGIDATTVSTTSYLRSTFRQATWRDGEVALKTARSIKSEDEVRLVGIAAEIVDGSLHVALEKVDYDGITDQQVAAEAIRAAFHLGAEYLPLNPIVASGGYAATYYPLTTDRLITPDDFVIVDFSAIHDGYCARVARTVFTGRHVRSHRNLYQAVYGTLQEGIDHCRPGSLATDVAVRMSTRLPGGHDGYAYARGRGIGLSVNEFPRIREGSDDTLVAGMVVALEAGAHLPGRGGVRLCETVCVTEGAPVRLTRLQFDSSLLQ